MRGIAITWVISAFLLALLLHSEVIYKEEYNYPKRLMVIEYNTCMKVYKGIVWSWNRYIHSYHFILIITQFRKQKAISIFLHKVIEILLRIKWKGAGNWAPEPFATSPYTTIPCTLESQVYQSAWCLLWESNFTGAQPYLFVQVLVMAIEQLWQRLHGLQRLQYLHFGPV